MTDTPWVLIERVAAAMYTTPDPNDPDAPIHPWPPTHPDDHAWWMAHAKAAINAQAEWNREHLMAENLRAFEDFAKPYKPEESNHG